MIAQFSMFPTDKGPSVSAYVAKVLDIVDTSGLPYKLGPMSTSIEGDWDEVFSVIKRCRDELAKHSNRIYVVISVDDRKGANGRLTGKIADVEERLGKKLST